MGSSVEYNDSIARLLALFKIWNRLQVWMKWNFARAIFSRWLGKLYGPCERFRLSNIRDVTVHVSFLFRVLGDDERALEISARIRARRCNGWCVMFSFGNFPVVFSSGTKTLQLNYSSYTPGLNSNAHFDIEPSADVYCLRNRLIGAWQHRKLKNDIQRTFLTDAARLTCLAPKSVRSQKWPTTKAG